MSIDKIPDLFTFIQATQDPKVIPTISFFGGEPTLNWDFIQAFVDSAREQNLRFQYSMNTNASCLTPEKIDFLISNRFGVVISLDGIQKAHDATRKYQNGSGTWFDIMKILPNLIGKFSANNLPLTAMMVVDNQNFQYLEESYLFLLTLGFLEVNILWNFDVQYSTSEYQIIKDQLISLFHKKRVKPYLDLQRRIWNRDSQDIKKNGHYCQSTETCVTINPKGQLFFCHRLTPKMSQVIEQDNYPESFGNIYDGYINEEYLQFIHNRIDINISQKPECLECPALPFCKGGCIGAIRNNTGEYDHLESLCNLNRLLADVFYFY